MSFVERCRQRHLGSEGGDEGFTLIELLVVLLIIGILLAIAIPTFLSVTKGASNTAAQSNLQNALTGAKTYFTDSNQSYVGIENPATSSSTSSNISQIGTGLTWVSKAVASTAAGTVSADVLNSGAALILAVESPGTRICWVILDNTLNAAPGSPITATNVDKVGTYYGSITVTSSALCKASTVAPTNFQTTGFPA